MRLLALPPGYTQARVTKEELAASWLIMGTSETMGLDPGPGWINLSVPWTAVNYHLRNLELIVEQGGQPRGIVWIMPEPTRVTVFDHGDRVLRWGVREATDYSTQGQTPPWDQALRLRAWQHAADHLYAHNHWWTWSKLTHQLVGWSLIEDAASPDWTTRILAKLKTLA